MTLVTPEAMNLDPKFNLGNIRFVSKTNGDDGSAIQGNPQRSYATIAQAITDSSAGETVVVTDGDFSEDGIQLKDDVAVIFQEGVTVTATGAFMFTIANAGNYKVVGGGKFISDGAGILFVNNVNSNFVFEGELIARGLGIAAFLLAGSGVINGNITHETGLGLVSGFGYTGDLIINGKIESNDVSNNDTLLSFISLDGSVTVNGDIIRRDGGYAPAANVVLVNNSNAGAESVFTINGNIIAPTSSRFYRGINDGGTGYTIINGDIRVGGLALNHQGSRVTSVYGNIYSALYSCITLSSSNQVRIYGDIICDDLTAAIADGFEGVVVSAGGSTLRMFGGRLVCNDSVNADANGFIVRGLPTPDTIALSGVEVILANASAFVVNTPDPAADIYLYGENVSNEGLHPNITNQSSTAGSLITDADVTLN